QVGVLIGASGSGKSTLLRCINGLENFQGGTIDVGGVRLDADPTRASRRSALQRIRLRVGMVFQQFNLFPHLNVIENVMEAPVCVLRQPRDAARVDATRLLDRVGLGDKLQSLPHQLSGGQQQRVAIARALAMKPEMILFDEPTSALDPRMTGEVLSVMTDLAKEGQTMLVVTHAMNFARRVANVVHVLSAGRVVESGPPEQVFESPDHPATRELLRDAASV
ncbi:MAG: amino acid ABC transporter ATP-binding protein, partial [Planctomycetota bacterium]|nr:amino acid ABC transporter ATP-binding protein [Planctomycetota bacterium]